MNGEVWHDHACRRVCVGCAREPAASSVIHDDINLLQKRHNASNGLTGSGTLSVGKILGGRG